MQYSETKYHISKTIVLEGDFGFARIERKGKHWIVYLFKRRGHFNIFYPEIQISDEYFMYSSLKNSRDFAISYVTGIFK